MASLAALAYLARSRKRETFRTLGRPGAGVAKGSGRKLALRLEAKRRIRKARPSVRQAGITSPGKAIAAAILRAPLARSLLRRIPGVSRLIPGSPARIARAEQQLGFAMGPQTTALATQVPSRLATVARRGAQIGAVGAAFGVGEEVVSRALRAGFGAPNVRFPVNQRRGGPQMAGGRGLAIGQELPPSHTIVNSWQTFPGGPVFYRLADGHIAVQKKNGTWKHFRPYRPVVIPRKWNARSMSRVATALKRQRKTATKIMQITGGLPKGRR